MRSDYTQEAKSSQCRAQVLSLSFVIPMEVRDMHIRLLLVLVTMLIATPSHAQLKVCNKSNKRVSVAVMYFSDSSTWTSEGWWWAEPSECVTPIRAPLKNRIYYVHAKRGDGVKWGGGDSKAKGCVASTAFTLDSERDCNNQGARTEEFFSVDTGDQTAWTSNLTMPSESTEAPQTQDIDRACKALYARLDRPKLRSEKIVIGHYTDIFTPPQTKSECTNVYDTGVPDPSTCTTVVDDCASKWYGPFGSWGCIPGTTTSCTNIKACNTYAHYKKTMECDVTLQLKLPNFVERPLSSFIDDTYNAIDSARASLPLICAPPEVRTSSGLSTEQAIAEFVTREIQRRIRIAVEREVRRWVEETAITTIASSIPSGGLGGAAALSTSIGSFVYRTHRAVEPIIRFANETKDFAEDLGFSTSCGWSDWHTW